MMTMTQTVEAMKSYAEQARAITDQWLMTGKDRFAAASEQAATQVGDMAAFGRANVEALVASGEAIAAGAREAGDALTALARTAIETNTAAGKAMLQAGSVNELVALQRSWVEDSVKAAQTEMQNLVELSNRVAQAAAAPITERVRAAATTLARPSAV